MIPNSRSRPGTGQDFSKNNFMHQSAINTLPALTLSFSFSRSLSLWDNSVMSRPCDPQASILMVWLLLVARFVLASCCQWPDLSLLLVASGLICYASCCQWPDLPCFLLPVAWFVMLLVASGLICHASCCLWPVLSCFLLPVSWFVFASFYLVGWFQPYQ